MRIGIWLALTLTLIATPRVSAEDVPSPAPSVSPWPSARDLLSRRRVAWPRNDYDEVARIIHITKPVYPKKPFADGVEGTVDIEFVISETGAIADLLVVKSIPGLDEAALECVKQWRFDPAIKAGEAVASVAKAPVTFRIIPPDFAEIQAQSKRGSRRREVMRWEQQNVAAMNVPLAAALRSCRATELEGKDAPFTALVQLAADGQVRATLVSPLNPFSACVQAELKKLAFGGSPWEGYWLEIVMQR